MRLLIELRDDANGRICSVEAALTGVELTSLDGFLARTVYPVAAQVHAFCVEAALLTECRGLQTGRARPQDS